MSLPGYSHPHRFSAPAFAIARLTHLPQDSSSATGVRRRCALSPCVPASQHQFRRGRSIGREQTRDSSATVLLLISPPPLTRSAVGIAPHRHRMSPIANGHRQRTASAVVGLRQRQRGRDIGHRRQLHQQCFSRPCMAPSHSSPFTTPPPSSIIRIVLN